MKIATARKKTSTHWRTQDITWEQFLDRLRKPLRTGDLFSVSKRKHCCNKCGTFHIARIFQFWKIIIPKQKLTWILQNKIMHFVFLSKFH